MVVNSRNVISLRAVKDYLNVCARGFVCKSKWDVISLETNRETTHSSGVSREHMIRFCVASEVLNGLSRVTTIHLG